MFVSTRKVKAITEKLRPFLLGLPPFPAIWTKSVWSEKPGADRPRRFPTPLIDARYEKVREGGVVMSQAVLVAIGLQLDNHQILAVEMANRESRSSWKDFLIRLAQTRPQRRRVGRRRRSCRPALGHPRGPVRRRFPALLRPLPATPPRSPAAQGRRRLPAGNCSLFYSRSVEDPATTSPPGSPNGARVIRGSSEFRNSRRNATSTGCRRPRRPLRNAGTGTPQRGDRGRRT